MSVKSFDIYEKPLDYFQKRYLSVFRSCFERFEQLNNPKIAENYYFQEENLKLLKNYTGLSLKIILSYLTEQMQYMLSEDAKYHYDDDEKEFMPLMIKDGQIMTFFLYRYMKKTRLIRKIVPTGFDVDYCLLHSKQVKYLNIANVQFFADPEKDKEFKERVRQLNLKRYETETTCDFGMQDDAAAAECAYDTYDLDDEDYWVDEDDWDDKDDSCLIRSNVKVLHEMYCDRLCDRDVSEAEAEDDRLVRQARKIGVMPWELLPLKEEYRNKPFDEWDFKPIFPVVGYSFGSYGYFEFLSYGAREQDLLIEHDMATVVGLDVSECDILDLYTSDSDSYTNELLNAMKAGRRQLNERDFREFFEPLKNERAINLEVLSERCEELARCERLDKLKEYKERLEANGRNCDLEQLHEVEDAIDDLKSDIMGDYIDLLDKDEIWKIDEDDELYGCTLNDDEFFKFAKEKFFKENPADVWRILHWNRVFVYPKILTE